MTALVRLLSLLGRFAISTARGGYQTGHKAAAWVEANLVVRR